MGYYLLDHPNPNCPQTRHRSAWGWSAPTGLVTVHTAEGALDRITPDTGAENVANFIATRTDYGGYHVLVDTDSTIDMAPDDLMTWHTAAGNLNGPGWGISAACRSTEWDPDTDWTRTIIARMGTAIRAFWERQGHDPQQARWIPGRDVLAAGGRVVGLVHHGDVQPGDRSDAWATHPRRAELDQMLIDAITGATQPDNEEEELMGALDEIRQEFVNQDTRTRAVLLACFDAQLNHLHATVDMATARLADLIRAADSSTAGADIELRDGLAKLVADLEASKRPTMAELVPELVEPAA